MNWMEPAVFPGVAGPGGMGRMGANNARQGYARPRMGTLKSAGYFFVAVAS
jgi:hypothetical protein